MDARTRRCGWMLALGGLCSLVPACQLGGPHSAGQPHTQQQAALERQALKKEEAAREAAEAAESTEASRKPDYQPVLLTPPRKTEPSPGITAVGARSSAVPAAPVSSVPIAVPVPTPGPPVDLEPKQPGSILRIQPVTTPGAPPSHEEQEDHRTSNKTEEPAILAALRCYLNKRPDDALTCIKKCDPASHDLLICLLPLAVQLAEGGGASSRQMAVTIEQMETLLCPLRSQAPLVIDKMCFCKTIKCFGAYEPVAEDHVFHPGEHVQIYAELRNFSSERQESRAGRPLFVTRLASAIEIHDDAAKKLVWKNDFHRDSPDLSQTQRHDYFDHYDFWLPELRPGWYKLEIIAEDQATHRKARGWLDLKVGRPTEGS